MKNQFDLIISIVCGVLAVIGCIVIGVTAPAAATPQASPTITSTNIALPESKTLVTYTNSLPGGGGAGGGMMGVGGAGRMMGGMGMGMGGGKFAGGGSGGPAFMGGSMGGGARKMGGG